MQWETNHGMAAFVAPLMLVLLPCALSNATLSSVQASEAQANDAKHPELDGLDALVVVSSNPSSAGSSGALNSTNHPAWLDPNAVQNAGLELDYVRAAWDMLADIRKMIIQFLCTGLNSSQSISFKAKASMPKTPYYSAASCCETS